MRIQSSTFRVQNDSNRESAGMWSCPSTSSGRTAFFPVMLSLSKHLLTLCLLLIITACTGSSSNPVASSQTVTFSGAASPGNDTVYMSVNNALTTSSTLAIDIKCSNITGSVYGAAFDVDFDSTKVTYSDKVAGDFLESGGNTVNSMAVLQSGSTNKLKVGVTRLGPVAGRSGNGTLVTLKFNVVTNASGSSSAAFSNNTLQDSVPAAIPGITWIGGTVTVQ